MKTFATVSAPGTFATQATADVLVGRLVANTSFLKALFRHGSFEEYCFFIGEASDVPAFEKVFVETGHLRRERLKFRNVLELPAALSARAISVFHYASCTEPFFDLVSLRDRHAREAIPITCQIHTLSYPRTLQGYLRGLLHPPSAGDAIFCSSLAGRSAVEKGFAAAGAALEPFGRAPEKVACELPVVPLGVDVASLRRGDRRASRKKLKLPPDAFVVLGMARFTEYDKMDLFPLLQAFKGLCAREDKKKPLHLLLAGARQGTKTPEMVNLWAKILRIDARVTLRVDFSEEEKKELLAAADLFVSPTDNIQETFGISVVEALAGGLPVVASDFDGYKDTVSDDVGLRVKTRWGTDLSFLSELGMLLYERPMHLFLGQSVEIDLPELEAALTALYLDDGLRREMAKKASERASSRYDWSVVIPAYEAVWRRLAEKPFTPRPSARPPLAMDFREIFSDWVSETFPEGRIVRRSELSRQLCTGRNQYVVYPELRNLLRDEDVVLALSLAEEPTAWSDLRRAVQERLPDSSRSRIDFLLSFLVKHGLLVESTR
jgi:glycosyltransferase involved in cell wall biosynthesis